MSRLALIPAAGRGARLNRQEPKQYALLAGRPMLWHAIRAVSVPQVEMVFVVLAPDDATFAALDWTPFKGKLEPLYCGGESRRESVYNSLVALLDSIDADDWLLVHDAARPCLPQSDVEKLVSECEQDEVGGLLAVPIADTVKRAADDRVQKTEDRSALWLAQTPQMFRAGLLLQALKGASASVTDEAAAIEAMGFRPKLVTGSRENLKVTWPEDLVLAEAILKARA